MRCVNFEPLLQPRKLERRNKYLFAKTLPIRINKFVIYQYVFFIFFHIFQFY